MVEVWTSAGGRRDDAQLGYQIAVAHDKLGWTNFVEGRISKKYVEVQTDHILSNTNSRRRRKLSAKWASGFVDGIIRITHRQWLYRNEYIHYTHQYGSESPLERRRSLARITHLHEHTDPDDLLPKDHYLLDLIRISTTWLCGIHDNATSSRPSSGHPWRNDGLDLRELDDDELDSELTCGRDNIRGEPNDGRTRKDKDGDNRTTGSRKRSLASSFAGTTSEGSQRHKRRKKKTVRT